MAVFRLVSPPSSDVSIAMAFLSSELSSEAIERTLEEVDGWARDSPKVRFRLLGFWLQGWTEALVVGFFTLEVPSRTGIRSSLSDIYDPETRDVLEVGVGEGSEGGGFGSALGVLVTFGGRPLAFFVVEGLGVGATSSRALSQSSDSDSMILLRGLPVDFGGFGEDVGSSPEDSDSTDSSLASFRPLVDFGGAIDRALFLSVWTGVAISSSSSSATSCALAFFLDLAAAPRVLLVLLVLLTLLTLASESEPSVRALDLDRVNLRGGA